MKILVIGDACFDEFIYGKCTRINPEAPTPVFEPNGKIVENYGMASNVVRNVNSLSLDWLKTSVHFRTNDAHDIHKCRYVDENSNYIILRIDTNEPEKDKFDSDEFELLMTTEDIDCVIISDYNKGFVTSDDIRLISQLCFNKNIPTFLDTKKILGQWSDLITFIKINELEYKESNKASNRPESEWTQFNLVVTMGGEGCLLKTPSKTFKIKQDEVEVRDVVGAGDTFLAALAVRYLECRDPYDSCVFANKAARVAVSKPGVVAVNRHEIK